MEPPAASIEARLENPEGICVLTFDVLNVDQIVKSVGDDSAGATTVFVGTTRNSFQGKVVTRLEYEAYSNLAIKTIRDIMRAACETASTIRCAVHHRLGRVDVGEASIVIAVSSSHRKESFIACEQILEEVKQKAQIWKREYYEGAAAEWKANN